MDDPHDTIQELAVFDNPQLPSRIERRQVIADVPCACQRILVEAVRQAGGAVGVVLEVFPGGLGPLGSAGVSAPRRPVSKMEE